MPEPADTLSKEILRVLSRPDAAAREMVQDLAARYAELVREANVRLGLAHRWLREGLRSEALGLIEQPPDALEAATQLSLGYGWKQWSDLCASHGVGNVPCPDVDAAGDLSAAYDYEVFLAEHLTRHRTLALANAPLPRRLEVLDVLAQCDPENGVWGAQIRDLETQRHAQITQELRTATAAGDLKHLRRLHHELAHRRWLSPPPEALVKAVSRAVGDVARSQAVAEYERLAAELKQAYEARDEAAMGPLVERWDQVQPRSGTAPPEALAAEVDPALRWWRQREAARRAEEQFRRDLAQMEALLDEQAPMRQLEPLYERLCRAEREIPRHVIARYRSRRDEYLRQRRLQMGLIGGAVIGLIAVVAGAVGWWIVHNNQRTRLADWVTQISAAVDAEDLQRTEELLESLQQRDPAMWDAPQIVALRTRYKQLQQQESARRQRLKTVLGEIDALDPLDESVPDKLKEARHLARSQEERLAVAQRRERITRARRERQQTLDAEFRARLGALNDDYRRILAADEPPQEKVRRLTELAARYEAALRSSNASPELLAAGREQLATLNADLDRRRKKLTRKQQAGDALQALRTKYRDLSAYEQAARAFVDAFPERPEARWLDAVLKEAPAWRALRPWNDFAEAWSDAYPLRESRAAADLARRLKKLPAPVTAFVGQEQIEDLTAYFDRAAVALDPDRSAVSRIIRMFELPWMNKLQRLVAHDGKLLYYVLDGDIKQTHSSPPTYQVSGVVVSLEGLLLADKRVTRLVRTPDGPPRLEPTKLAAFARKETEKLRGLQPGQWRTIHLELARDAAGQTDLDAVLRLSLVRTFLKWHEREGWPPVSDDGPVHQYLDKIDRATFGRWKLQEVPWPAPAERRPDVKRARGDAAEVLTQLPDIPGLIARSDAAMRRLRDRFRLWKPVGLVWIGPGGKPALSGPGPDGLFGVLRLRDGRLEFQICGSRSGSKVSFLPDRVPPFGMPVFRPPPWSVAVSQDERP